MKRKPEEIMAALIDGVKTEENFGLHFSLEPDPNNTTGTWYNMSVNAKAKTAEVYIYDVIGAWGVSAQRFVKDLKDLGNVTKIDLHINSPGGSVFDGAAIYNALDKHRAEIEVYIDGLAASMGSYIAMVGEKVNIAENAFIMIHNPWVLVAGDEHSLRKQADLMTKVKNSLAKAYIRRSGMSSEEIKTLMDEETWYDAEEAIANGFADSSVDAVDLIENVIDKFDLSIFNHTPEFDMVMGCFNVNAKEGPDMPTKKPIPDATENPTAPSPSDEEVKAQGAAENQTRIEGIYGVFKKYPQHTDLRDQLIKTPTATIEMARQQLLDKLGEGVEPAASGNPFITFATDEWDRKKLGLMAAMSIRMGGEANDEKNEFRSLSLLEMARLSLEAHGVSTKFMDRRTLAGVALGIIRPSSLQGSGSHSTSDFPYLLENVAYKRLQAAYNSFPETWPSIAVRGEVSDFKVNSRIRLGTFNSLDTVPELGEFTHGSFSEEKETIQAATKGKLIGFSRQMLINDDLSGFNRITQMMGRAAKRTVGNDVYSVINTNGNMADGNAIFNTTDGNKAASGGAISVTTLSAGKAAMRLMKDPDDNDYLNTMMRTLLVPVAVEDHALTTIGSETDNAQSNSRKPNIHRNTLTVVSDPRLDAASATAWYMFADPEDIPVIEVAFLDGNDMPYLEMKQGFEIDGLTWKVRLDYGVDSIDRNGGYMNAGA